MSECPADLASVLDGFFRGEAPMTRAPRYVPCSRCSKSLDEYQKHDASWMPPRAMYWYADGRLVWGANCEACNWIEFQERVAKRLAEIGQPDEIGISSNERERRHTLGAKLHREIERYKEGRRKREAAYARAGDVVHCDPQDETLAGWLNSQGVSPTSTLFTPEQLEQRRQDQIAAARRLAQDPNLTGSAPG